MKAIVLTRGGLADTPVMDEFPKGNPCSDVRLNCQKSAEAIVFQPI